MFFCDSGLRSTYASSEVSLPSDLDDWKRSSLASLVRFEVSSMSPSLMAVPYSAQNLLYSSSSSRETLRIMSRTLRVSFLRIDLSILFCWSISRETLSGRLSESTMPRTKERYDGRSPSKSSVMNTRRT
eukprot:Amastigsp_a846964_49.p3 type:complete len:129 gc:universal Amastigsp_a846964_49:770-1156(+)